MDLPTVVILGASGLIGHDMVLRLGRSGFRVVAVARRFSAAQHAAGCAARVEAPFVDRDAKALAALLAPHAPDVIVNCVGVLQDGPRSGGAADVHAGFVGRLADAVAGQARPCLLVHVSIPGRVADDSTTFAVTKRQAEHRITESGLPYVILRPGFVVAPAAYGGSALIRALAMLPFDLPARESGRPFAATDSGALARTVDAVARQWQAGRRNWSVTWDVMEANGGTVGSVIAAFRRRMGGPRVRLRLPAWLMAGGARAGDVAGRLGWLPPIRSTALVEMRRGVAGDPGPWTAATGLASASLEALLAGEPATVQDRWFARLYLLKPLVLGGLSAFWLASGLIALTAAFDTASGVLAAAGVPLALSKGLTAATALADCAVAAAIAIRRTCRAGLRAGIALSTSYLAGATVLAPALWLDPLGVLVKVVPIIVLMLVALAILEAR